MDHSLEIEKSNTINESFDIMRKYLLRLTNKDDESNIAINETSLRFYKADTGYADAVVDAFESFITFNVNVQLNYKKTILHEFTHILTESILDDAIWKKGGHSLEFAIVYYSLEYKYFKTDIHISSYDIKDDQAYANIYINPSMFNSFIQSIKWASIEELKSIAKVKAQEIRDRLLKMT